MEEKGMYWYHNLRTLAFYGVITMLLLRLFFEVYAWPWVIVLVGFYLLYAVLRPRTEKFQTEDWIFVIPVIIITIFFLLDKDLAIRGILLQFFAIAIPIYAFATATKKQRLLAKTKDRFGVHG